MRLCLSESTEMSNNNGLANPENKKCIWFKCSVSCIWLNYADIINSVLGLARSPLCSKQQPWVQSTSAPRPVFPLAPRPGISTPLYTTKCRSTESRTPALCWEGGAGLELPTHARLSSRSCLLHRVLPPLLSVLFQL